MPAHVEKMLAYEPEQRLGTGETMRRREFISLIAGATAWPVAARAQQPPMPVIGFLTPAGAEAQISDLLAAFRQGLAEAGYVEGKSLAIEYRFTNFKLEAMPEAADDLVRRNVNVIFAATPDAVAAVQSATTTIPAVGVDLENDPVAKGYVKSLARPGGNITGTFLDIPELSGKQVGLLKEIVPGLSRIAIFGDSRLNALQFTATENAVRALALEAEVIEMQVAEDFERAFESARKKNIKAGVLVQSPLVFVSLKQIADLAVAKRLPLISLFGEFPKVGGLVAYGPNLNDLFRRCGGYVAKVLHGAKPSELPIQRPERFDLVINLKTAAALGVDVPSQLQQLANEVIE
jgi:putative tryptophan/tyrosine transport system substrate-binding protein